MIQRLIVPLAFRSLLLSVVIATIVCIFLTPVRYLRDEQSMSATLKEVSAGVSWTGSAVSSNTGFDPLTCTKLQTCDVFTLNVDITDTYRTTHPDFALSIGLTWDDPQNDFDLYVSKDGRTIEDSSQGQTNSEEIRVDRPANGIYHVFTHAAAAAKATTYSGQVKLIASPLKPPQRTARYQKDPDGRHGPEMFQFAPEVVLEKGENFGGLRTAIAIDPFGATYVASDGSDLAVGDPQLKPGTVYAEERPRWGAAMGASHLYVASSESERLVLRRSEDGGRTYLGESVITRLGDVDAAAGQGNLVTNGTGTLFNVFTGTSRNEIYIARCVEPCERFVTRRIFSGGADVNLAHPYPVVALDRAGGLHVAFSDGRKVFLISSADGGATWKDPAVVNNPEDPDTVNATSPWLFAGDCGRVGITWLGPRGEAFYGFTSDAFAPVPAFSYVNIADGQPNSNLPAGAADPVGNANIVYGRTRLLRQIAGARLVFGPFMSAVGTVKTETGTNRVSLNVRQDFSGSLAYLDEQRKLSLRSGRFTSSRRMDQRIAVSGLGMLQDGSEVTFTLVTSEPGVKEREFSLSMSNGYFAAGTLQDLPFPQSVSVR